MGLILRVWFYIIVSFLFSAYNVSGAETPDSLSHGNSFSPDSIQIDTLLLTSLRPDTLQLDSIRSIHGKASIITKKDSTSKDTVKYWKTGGCLTLNISQVSLTNWSSGGQNSIAANSMLNLTANYARENAAWDNALDFGFGRIKKEKTKAVKTDDKLEISTKYGRRIAKKWYYSAMLNLKTQVFPGYSYPEKDSVKLSDFLSPGFAFLSIGIDYKPNNNFTFLLSTVTGKTTIVKSQMLANREAYGVDSGKHFRHEFGGYMKLVKKGSFLKVVNYQFKIDAFSNYMEKPENVDWDCELMIWAKVNKYITANFKANLLYDDDIVTAPNNGPRLQRRQFIGIGFSYRL